MRHLIPALLLLVLASCTTVPAPVSKDPLVEAMAQRLELAREVAWFKYTNHQPVRDPRREAEVIDRMAGIAASRGMNVPSVRTFFTAQIAASCAEQEHLLRQWQRGTPTPTTAPRDLRTAIRADIDATNLALLDALGRGSVRANLQSRAEATLRENGFASEAVALAVEPL
jgi:chorismate mutase